MKKFLIALAAAFVLCVPAFADNEVYFASLPFSLTNSSHAFTVTASNVSGVSYAYLQDTGEGIVTINVLSEDPDAVTSFYRTDRDSYINSSAYVAFGDYYRYVYDVNYFSPGYTTSIAITPFPGTADSSSISSAFADFLANQPSPEPVGLTSVLVPRGNVLYFKAASNYVFGFEAEFSKYSALLGGGNVYGPWGDTYQRISVESSLPSAGITFPRPNSTAISWEKGAPFNVLGQSKKGIYRMTVEADGNYIAFYNPAYQSVTGSDGDGSAEVGCNVWVTGDFDFIRIYPLQQLLDTSSSPDDYEDYLNGTPDGDTVIWTDPDNNVSAPVSGGDNQEDEPISSISLIESIKRILRNILSEIENIFTFGFSAIRDLVDLMDEFVATFDDLYEWLPEECYTLLIASVSVAIVIGVFKVFL